MSTPTKSQIPQGVENSDFAMRPSWRSQRRAETDISCSNRNGLIRPSLALFKLSVSRLSFASEKLTSVSPFGPYAIPVTAGRGRLHREPGGASPEVELRAGVR